MREIPAALAADLAGDVVTTAICWQVQKRDGSFIRGTEHDQDIEFIEGSPDLGLSGTYFARANITGSSVKSSSDMSVDNLEVMGATGGDVDVSVDDMEAGVLDKAAVTIFVVNWRAPDHGCFVMKEGYLGQSQRDSDKGYQLEIRGLTQALSQNIGQTFSETCNVVRFGDARCKLDLAPLTRTAEVLEVVSRRQFLVSTTPAGAAPRETYWDGAELTSTDGANSGFFREVKMLVPEGPDFRVFLWDEMPEDIEVGDHFDLPPACPRTYDACKAFGNVLNMRAYGLFVPAADAMLKGPT